MPFKRGKIKEDHTGWDFRMWAFVVLKGRCINGVNAATPLIRKCMGVLPGQKSGRNKELTILT